jgi:hypothetical protein
MQTKKNEKKMSTQPEVVVKFFQENSEEGLEKINNLSNLFDGKLEAFVQLPNFSANQKFAPPSGFAVRAKANQTPLHTDLFDGKMFKRTAVYELPEGFRILGSKESATEEFILNNSERLKQLINSVFIEEQSKAKISLKLIDQKSGKETKEWKEEMGYGGSFIGLYSSNERSDYHYKNKFYLVAQTYSPSANKEIENLINDASPTTEVGPTSAPKHTFETFFDHTKNKDLANLSKMSKRNSHRQLARLATVMNLQDAKGNPIELNFQKDLSSSSNQEEAPWILNPTIDICSNVVEKYNGKMVYRNGAIDPSQHKNGIPFCEAPLLGVTILKGPSLDAFEFGGSWKATEDSLGSFPIHSGRKKDARQLSKDLSNKKYVTEKGPVAELLKPFVWNNHEKAENPRLVVNAYRTRDSNWKKIEKQLGYDHSNGEIYLKPLVVKIAIDKK